MFGLVVLFTLLAAGGWWVWGKVTQATTTPARRHRRPPPCPRAVTWIASNGDAGALSYMTTTTLG
jgi:hypothetical protein